MSAAAGDPLVLDGALWRIGPAPDDCMRKQSLIELTDRVGALLAGRLAREPA